MVTDSKQATGRKNTIQRRQLTQISPAYITQFVLIKYKNKINKYRFVNKSTNNTPKNIYNSA